jgi:hypothetical protein
MNPGPDLLTMIRAALSASSTSSDPAVAGYYAALARTGFAKLVEEVKAIELPLVARERELALRAGPRQLAIASTEQAPTEDHATRRAVRT